MVFETRNGQSFQLHVDRYEHPDEELVPTADNPREDFDRGRFLFVTVSVTCPEGTWSATAPELTTTQLERLAMWLESISNGQQTALGVYFTERDLEFSVNERRTAINVHLYRDFVPPWLTDRDLTIEFPLEQIDLGLAVSYLRSQLIRFPHRPMPEQPS